MSQTANAFSLEGCNDMNPLGVSITMGCILPELSVVLKAFNAFSPGVPVVTETVASAIGRKLEL